MANCAMIGMLAAAAAALSAAGGLVHGHAIPVDITAASATAGLASYSHSPRSQKNGL